MNKKQALVLLIKTSFIVPLQIKSDLINEIGYMTQQRINTLGRLFAYERELALQNEVKITEFFKAFVAELQKTEDTSRSLVSEFATS